MSQSPEILQLPYSLSPVEPIRIAGRPPYPDLSNVAVKLTGALHTNDRAFPPDFNSIGTFIVRVYPNQEFSICVRLIRIIAETPPSTTPRAFSSVPLDRHAPWQLVPYSKILGTIEIALNEQAVQLIQRVNAEGHSYEIPLNARLSRANDAGNSSS